MKIIECEQGTPEWFAARAGIPTASEFDKILTAGGKASTQLEGYANLLIAEMLVQGQVETWGGSMWTQRGKELEAEAANWYAYEHDAQLQVIGFCVTDDGLCGCSPDRLVGDSGLLEIKCPSPQVHVAYLLDPEQLRKAYYTQAQGQMFVTGRRWVDLLAYHPKMPAVVYRIERSVDYMIKFRPQLDELHLMLAEKKAKMIKLGHMKGTE